MHDAHTQSVMSWGQGREKGHVVYTHTDTESCLGKGEKAHTYSMMAGPGNRTQLHQSQMQVLLDSPLWEQTVCCMPHHLTCSGLREFRPMVGAGGWELGALPSSNPKQAVCHSPGQASVSPPREGTRRGRRAITLPCLFWIFLSFLGLFQICRTPSVAVS